MANTSITASSVKDLLAECWSAEPPLQEDGSALHPALTAIHLVFRAGEASPESPDGPRAPSPAESCQRILKLLVAAFKAERAFLFEVPAEAPEEAAKLGPCLASCDLDGEPIHQPERRVPARLLARVARAGLPALGSPAEGDTEAGEEERQGGRPPGSVSFPVGREGRIWGALHVENRFQPLELSRDAIILARACTELIECIWAAAKLRKENEDLWVDFQRLRESRAAPAPPPRAAASRERPRQHKRAELKGDYSSIIGSSPRMLEIFQLLDRISGSNASVLISGESGTGKELIARAVHENSPRRGEVFVSENCGALTETLLESELFGYVKGAFTGASKDHQGLFEHAIGGTLFLDEVGDMSPGMQKKLLRVLQEGIIRRVGGKDYVPVDVRVISATNKDLMAEVRAGNFREDLYYRLNVINLRMPPLRERKEDIPELVDHFLAELERETSIHKEIEPAAMEHLVRYDWPGNVRELRNEIKRVVTLSDGNIGVRDLSEALIAGTDRELSLEFVERELSHLTLKEATERVEKELIRTALMQAHGNKSLVAKSLKVPKTSLYSKINKYGLEKL